MTGPVPNRGYEAAARQRLGVVIKQLEQLVPLAGATTDIGKAVLEALGKLTKHIQAGEVTPAAERNTLEQAQMRNQQNMALQQQMRAGGQQPPAAPPQAAGGPMGAAGPQMSRAA